MRASFIFLLFLAISGHSHSQSLQGEWQGRYYSPSVQMEIPIALYFEMKNDSSYKVYSYSKVPAYIHADSYTIVCSVNYTIAGEDSVYLEEVKVVKPKKDTSSCFQKMSLAIKHQGDKMVLEGSWTDADKKCGNESGEISFTRKNKKK